MVARGEFSSPEPASRNPVLTFGDIPCFILVMSEARKELLVDLLKATSRSFYLTLRVLPVAVRPQIGFIICRRRRKESHSLIQCSRSKFEMSLVTSTPTPKSFPRLFSCRKRLIFNHVVSDHRLH